jgi:hypothetical protein
MDVESRDRGDSTDEWIDTFGHHKRVLFPSLSCTEHPGQGTRSVFPGPGKVNDGSVHNPDPNSDIPLLHSPSDFKYFSLEFEGPTAAQKQMFLFC